MYTSTTTPTFITKWGEWGNGDGQFISPPSVEVDGTSNVYVTDIGNHRIQKFTSEGVFITRWGEQGTGAGQFEDPFDVVLDAQDLVYVTDTHNDCIQKFDSSGNFLSKWGGQGTGEGQFDSPRGVETDEQGNAYVADTQNHRIQKFAFRPAYEWEGFFPPVKNLPTFNEVNAGRAIPMKFSLGGDMGLEIFAEGFPASQHIDCETRATLGTEERTTPAGDSDLSFDETTGQYTYTWKTEHGWEESCRQVIMKLNDGTEHRALFRFK